MGVHGRGLGVLVLACLAMHGAGPEASGFGLCAPVEFGLAKRPAYTQLRAQSKLVVDPKTGQTVLVNGSSYDVFSMFLVMKQDLRLTVTAAYTGQPEAKLGVICLGVTADHRVDAKRQLNVGWHRRLKPDRFTDHVFHLPHERLASRSGCIFVLVYRSNRQGTLKLSRIKIEPQPAAKPKAPTRTGPVRLENDHWRVVVEPGWGARCRSLFSKAHDYDFVLGWEKRTDKKTGVQTFFGGAFCGHMCGSYVSEQEDEPYTVAEETKTSVTMVWRNTHTLFSDLEEKRVVRLDPDGRSVVVEIAVANRSDEPRTLYYRLHDFLGTGSLNGRDSIYLTPSGGGTVWALAAVHRQQSNVLVSPSAPWFAMVDLVGDLGLAVEVEQGAVRQFYYWLGRPRLRTAEVFFERKKLAPGQSWTTRVRLTAFAPSKPVLKNARLAKRLTSDAVAQSVRGQARRRMATGAPMGAELRPAWTDRPVTITPVHPLDASVGTPDFDRYAGTLERITLGGTPGERVPMAFAVTATRAVEHATVTCTDLASGGNVIPAKRIGLRYVSSDGWGYLVRDGTLARTGLPDTVCQMNNDIRDAETLTPLELDVGQTAFLWANVCIPDDATPGRYTGTCAVRAGSTEVGRFDVQLVVYSFRLERPKHKFRGTFFVRRLKTGKPDEPASRLARDQYVAALEGMDQMGYTALTIYESKPDNIRWVLDQCVKLGWKDRLFVLIAPYGVNPKELDERYGRHGFTFRAWVIDEPSRYRAVPEAIRRFRILSPRWGKRCIFTPNTPFGIAMADALPDIVPIFAHLGTAAYLVEVTRDYKSRGREVFWYGMPYGRPAAYKRLLRGICLWKEPVDGIIDWGEAASGKRPGHCMTGFAGSRVIPTIARENTRQAYTDLFYLHTLERAVASAPDSNPGKADAQRLLDWLGTRFEYIFSAEAAPFTQVHMDAIRQEVARHIIAVKHPGRRNP